MDPVHILLVEDNEGDIMLIEEAFDEAKLLNRMTILKDGEKAIRFLKNEEEFTEEDQPDLIILDVNLPRRNGHEVLEFIKKESDLSVIPVIMLTTSSSDDDITKSYKNHANCYITKPVEVEDFLAAVLKIEDFWLSLVELPTHAD
ncbi:MAG: response regulator [Bacteroidetes bacterium]|jgi:CheY-like chemotaxis protein|nr:response regulator [Bacteroidota bacterium]